MEGLRLWNSRVMGRKKSMLFAILIMQRKPKNYVDICYFCMTNIESVSYTHLDVYKRQPHDFIKKMIVQQLYLTQRTNKIL